MRLCFLAGTLGQGGAERQLYYILKCLKECSAEVNVLTLTTGEYWEAPILALGIPVHFVGASGSRIARLIEITKAVRRLKPDLVQSQHFYTSIYGAFAGRCLGIPSIGAVRSNGLSELKSNGYVLGALSLRLPHWVLANSKNAIRSLATLGYPPEKFLWLPNVIDTLQFRPGDKPLNNKEFVILGVGSLGPAKRFDRFLAIVATLCATLGRPVCARIAGDGMLQNLIAGLAASARQKGLGVELLGRVTDPLPLYQSSAVLLLSSDWEGTPNVIMEAMACGLPVVATNVGGVADLVQHGETGFLFPPEDVSGAVSALERLVREPRLALDIGARARAFIEQQHSINLLSGILSRLYGKILAAR